MNQKFQKTLQFICISSLAFACSNSKDLQQEPAATAQSEMHVQAGLPIQASVSTDSLRKMLEWPDALEVTYFAGPDVAPSPAGLAVHPNGDVYVGVDMIGSLGKTPGKGHIVKLMDDNNDGVADRYTNYADLDNPRGLFPIGDQLFVLYTTFDKTTGLASGMDLSVLEDKDNNGVADGPPQLLIHNLSSTQLLQNRGTDHATNGIRMGIDGWIYIAVGDYGFHEAVDRSGTKLTQLGGGILRVRPDGTEMEVYTHGLRNIYDVAIDPFMNIFTRGNTNDGGGWNIRFIHQIQSGEYGYPILFKHFTDEIIPALADLGGGSGTGSLFFDEPGWPAQYNKVPMMTDWGRNQVYIHRVADDGPSYTQTEESFIKLPQITDIDVDGSGRLFMSAWDGAGFRGDSSKGFVVQAVPKNWRYSPFPDLKTAPVDRLAGLLKSASAVARQHAQQELLTRPAGDAGAAALAVAADAQLSLEARVAGLFTYAQIAQKEGIEQLVKLTSDRALKAYALRALADRKPWISEVPMAPFIEGLNDVSDEVQVASIVGLGRLGRKEAAEYLLKTPVPPSAVAPAKDTEGLHATPNPSIIPAHLAVKALVAINAVDACVAAIGGAQSDLALWALRYMHDARAVDGLIAAYGVANEALKLQLLTTLSRLYQKEAPYDGSWHWGTRPDTHGPYYKAIPWELSDKIEAFLKGVWEQSDEEGKLFFAEINGKHRMGIEVFGVDESATLAEENQVDLNKISNQRKGQVGRASIEDVILAVAEIPGNPEKGDSLFTQQGCIACHSLKKDEVMKGPFMGQIGAIMTRDQIAEAILKPDASIAQGFVSVLITTKGNKSYAGFISDESADRVVVRTIAGQVFPLKTEDILSRKKLEMSMMPQGLANALSFEDFASLISFLSQQVD